MVEQGCKGSQKTKKNFFLVDKLSLLDRAASSGLKGKCSPYRTLVAKTSMAIQTNLRIQSQQYHNDNGLSTYPTLS